MKQKLLFVLVILLLLTALLPITGYAYGGYYVLKGEKIYHFVSCPEIMGYRIEDLKFYDTKASVEKSGCKPASCCSKNNFDYESDGATVWYSSDTKIQNALELERLYGIFDGYDAGKEEGYKTGYIDGSEEGHEAGFNEGLEKGRNIGLEEGKNSSKHLSILLCILVSVIGFVVGKNNKQSTLEQEVNEHKVERYKLMGKLSQYEEAMYVLEILAEKSNTSVVAIADQLFVNFQKHGGYSEEDARAMLNTWKQNRLN